MTIHYFNSNFTGEAAADTIEKLKEVESAKIIEAPEVKSVTEPEISDEDYNEYDGKEKQTPNSSQCAILNGQEMTLWMDDKKWMMSVLRKLMHRKETTGDEEVDGTTGGGGSGGSNGGGFNGVSNNTGGGGGVAGPSNNGTSSSNAGKTGNSGNGGNLVDMSEVDQFGYPDSPTQNWLAANADLSPLRILDNINLKSEFPYTISMEAEKPPDISNIGLDHNTPNLLQFAASVPVPDHSTTFLDIGLDNFQSLYEDQLIGDLGTSSGINTTTTTTINTDSTFTKLTDMTPAPAPVQQVDFRSLGIQNIQNIQYIQLPTVTNETILTTKTTPPAPVAFKSMTLQPPALKSLIEPLPASALQGLIKIEPSFEVKQEDTNTSDNGLDSFANMDYSEDSLTSPTLGGGKIKSNRKKSTASTDPEEDDISNLPSLQMRLQIIQQRVSTSIVSKF